MKIAINKCYGGFSVSEDVYDALGIKWDNYGFLTNDNFGIESDDYLKWRSHPKLIQAIESIGEDKASGSLAKIRIIDIPNGIEWDLDEYDGIESVHEQHRSW